MEVLDCLEHRSRRSDALSGWSALEFYYERQQVRYRPTARRQDQGVENEHFPADANHFTPT